jgi:hypothetical protein
LTTLLIIDRAQALLMLLDSALFILLALLPAGSCSLQILWQWSVCAQVIDVWEPVTESDVQTPMEVYQELVEDGYNVVGGAACRTHGCSHAKAADAAQLRDMPVPLDEQV